MKITKKQLRKIIREALEASHPSEVEAVENVWSGDPEGKAGNLELDLDHPKVAGGEETTKEPEMLPRQEDLVSERRLRRLARKIVAESQLQEADSFSGKLNKIRAELDKGNLDAAAKMYADMNDNPAYFGGDLEAIRFEFDETRDFFEDASAAVAREFEELAYKHLSDRSKKSVASSPYKNELQAISNSFTGMVTPAEVKFIVYQPRVRKGQLANVNMEDSDSMLGGMATGMTPEEAKRYGTTLEKVMAALDSMGARKRGRRKPVKRLLPYYD